MIQEDRNHVIRGDVRWQGRWVRIADKVRYTAERNKRIRDGLVWYNGEWISIDEKLRRTTPPETVRAVPQAVPDAQPQIVINNPVFINNRTDARSFNVTNTTDARSFHLTQNNTGNGQSPVLPDPLAGTVRRIEFEPVDEQNSAQEQKNPGQRTQIEGHKQPRIGYIPRKAADADAPKKGDNDFLD